MSGLPSGWERIALGDICGPTAQRVPGEDENFTYVDIASVDRDLKVIFEPQSLCGKDAPSRARKVIETGDVIVSMTRPNLNAVALVGEKYDGCIASTGFDVLKPVNVDPRWVFAIVRSSGFVEAMCEKVQGALYPAVKSVDIRGYEIPLPPLAEQARIAARLDELLAQVDTLKARIDGIPALLKRFRQSVLAAAVSGRLTEEWRARNSCPAWSEIKLEDMLAGTKDGICRGPFGSSIKKEFFVPAGYKVYEQKNAIRDSSFIGEYFVDEGKYKELERFSVRPGDFIVSCAGTLGRISLLPVGAPAGLINQALIRIRTNKYLVLDEYFLVLFRSPVFQEKLIVGARGGAMQNLASTKEIKALDIYCPAIPEQTEIVRRVEQLFAFADQLEAKVNEAKTRIDRLTQSILAKAFRGELVPQDPDDEPASQLLQRIQAQRASAPKAKCGRKKAESA